MSEQHRVLIIGLDGATWTVLGPWMEDGSLPNLARLRAEGSWGELRSTIPPLTAPAWSTFLTGKNPGKHGVFHFVPLDDGPQTDNDMPPGIVDSRSIQSPTLWDIFGHAGRKVGIINVPMSYPPRPVNGFMITCLLTPPSAAVFTYPPELSPRLTDYQIDLDRFIDQKPFARDLSGVQNKRIVKPSLQLVREFYDMEEIRARTALDLMESEPWDTFMVVFTATDRMGHYLWPYHLSNGDNASEEGEALHEAIHQLYQRLDHHIGQLVEKAGEGTSVIIMTAHGMGPIYSKNTHWNDWLHRMGYLKVDQRSATRSIDGWLMKFGIPRDRLRRLMHKIPGFASSQVAQKVRTAPTTQIDKQNSKAYYVRIFDPVGGIVINEQGEARETLRDNLIKALEAVTDPDTGKPIVRWALKREQCFTGPYSEEVPDIILVMHPEYGSSDRVSHYSTIVTLRPRIDDPGGHHMEGILIASGPKIQAIPEALPNLLIEDIAPTVLYMAELAVPEDMDGRVLTEIMDPNYLQANPILKTQISGRWPSDSLAVPILDATAEDDGVVHDRLRALGYME